MLGLIYRDWVLVKKTKAWLMIILYIVIGIVNGLANNDYVASFMNLFIIYITFAYLVSYDDKYDGLLFTSAFNVRRKDMVSSRFCFLSVILLISSIINSLPLFIIDHQEAVLLYSISMVLIEIISGVIYLSLITALTYHFGYQKSRWLMFISVFVIYAVKAGLLTVQGLTISMTGIILLILLLALAFEVGLTINIKLLEKKDF